MVDADIDSAGPKNKLTSFSVYHLMVSKFIIKYEQIRMRDDQVSAEHYGVSLPAAFPATAFSTS